jgi:DNA-binding response OmpR family regulator
MRNDGADMAKTILIADDEKDILDITRRKLTQEGYLVIGVSDGEAALQALREGAVDLIVLDVEMPGMNGYTFMTERQKIDGANAAPVIVLTAYDAMEPIFKRHGIRAYLKKPIQFQELLARIREVLADRTVSNAV